MMRATFTDTDGNTAVVYGRSEEFWVHFDDDKMEIDHPFDSWWSAVRTLTSLGFS